MLNINIPTVRCIIPHSGQEMILKHPARFKVVACGRRFGKTETGKLALLQQALNGGVGWWLAPTYRMANQVWRDLKADLKATNGVTISEADTRIDFPGGGVIAIRSTHTPDSLRGAGLDFAVLDEAAFMLPDVWSQVVRPMLLERRGGAMFLSTPFGRNWFYDLFNLGVDPHVPDWAAFHHTSFDNPHVDPDEIRAIRRITPEHVYMEEYLAQFTEDAGRVFRGVSAAATAPAYAQPQPGHRYIGGVDWGRDHDYTVIAIIDAHSGQMVALDRFNTVGWAVQRGRLTALVNHWQPAVVWAESNSIGAVNIEALQADGLPVRPFITSASSKRPLIEGLALAIERGEIALLDDPVLLGELQAYAIDRLPGGGYRFGAPPGGHDDTVIATALAWHGVRSGGLGLSFA